MNMLGTQCVGQIYFTKAPCSKRKQSIVLHSFRDPALKVRTIIYKPNTGPDTVIDPIANWG